MDLMFTIMIAGLCIMVSAFTVYYVSTRQPARGVDQEGRRAAIERTDRLRDICSATLWAGLALVTASNVGIRAGLGASTQELAVSAAVSAFFIWASGFYLGRVSLRRKLRGREGADASLER